MNNWVNEKIKEHANGKAACIVKTKNINEEWINIRWSQVDNLRCRIV